MLQGWLQIVVFVAVLFAVVPLLGGYMARVFTNERVFLTPVVGPLERLAYRCLRVDARTDLFERRRGATHDVVRTGREAKIGIVDGGSRGGSGILHQGQMLGQLLNSRRDDVFRRPGAR